MERGVGSESRVSWVKGRFYNVPLSMQAARINRVDSWRNFQKGGKKKKAKPMGLKPPKLKQEKR